MNPMKARAAASTNTAMSETMPHVFSRRHAFPRCKTMAMIAARMSAAAWAPSDSELLDMPQNPPDADADRSKYAKARPKAEGATAS